MRLEKWQRLSPLMNLNGTGSGAFCKSHSLRPSINLSTKTGNTMKSLKESF